MLEKYYNNVLAFHDPSDMTLIRSPEDMAALFIVMVKKHVEMQCFWLRYVQKVLAALFFVI